MDKDFLYCRIDDTHHRGGLHNEGKSRFISKFPKESMKLSDFIARIEKKKGNSKVFCVPTHISVEVKFTEHVISAIPSLGRVYTGSLAKVRDSLFDDLEGEKSDVTGNNRIVSSLSKLFKDKLGEYLDEIDICIEYKENSDGGPVDKSSYKKEGGSKTGEGNVEIKYVLGRYGNIIIEGVAGSGKSHMLQELRESGVYGENGSRIEVVVFHPSTSYEEFVSGIRPNFAKKAGEQSDFVSQEGVFVQMCNRAATNPGLNFLLFIDEINRANTSRVFGDLMLVLEKTKRVKFSSTSDNPEQGEVDPIYLSDEDRFGALYNSAVTTPDGDYVRLQTPIYKTVEGADEPLEFNKLVVPSNLHVLGTMNTTDRSVGTIDLALRRRFHWVTQHPLTAEELQKTMEESGEEYPENIASWYENANVILLNQVGPDARLGHAYFFGKDGDEEAIVEALLNQLKEVAFTFNVSQTILDEIGPVHGQKIFIRGAGLGSRPDIVDESYQG